MSKVLHLINDSSVERGGAQKILARINSIESGLSSFQYKVFSKSWAVNNTCQHQVCGGRFWILYLIILIIKYKPDLIIIHSRCYLPFVYLFRVLNSKVVFYCHANYRKKQAFFRFLKCDQYIAVSESVKQSLSLSVSAPITVITNPVESNSKMSPNIASELVFNYVGALQEWKGIDKLVHFLQLYCQENSKQATLNVVGDGPLASKVKCEAEHPWLKINILGYQSEPYKNLELGAIQVIPSLEEGFGIVAVEALINGSPVLYSNVPALKEILLKDVLSNGFDIYDFESFSNALKSLLNVLHTGGAVSDIRQKRSLQARNKYGYSSFKSKYIGLVEELLKG